MNRNVLIVLLLGFLTYSATCSSQRKSGKLGKVEVRQDTLTILTNKAESGNAVAQNTLGNWYYVGKNVPQDYVKAVHWWAKSAQQENADGVGNLALCYQLGRGLKADSVKAIALYKRAISLGNKEILPQHEKLADGKNGNLFSAQLLYQCYSQGVGVKQDENKAAKYKAMLVKAGGAEQKFKLALDYINHQQPDKAVPWLENAAKEGHVGAMFYLGRLLFRGTGVVQNRQRGVALMERAAEKEFPGACLEMGKLYLGNDELVEHDAKKAVNYLKKISGISSDAGWLLAQCYLKGEGVTQDYYLATQWIAEYAGSHQADLERILSEHPVFCQYLEGLRLQTINKDVAAAKSNFQKVAKSKISEGATMIARCFADKNYTKHNDKKAVKLMAKASKNSNAACFFLAQMYFQGVGTKRNPEEAMLQLKKAAEAGIGAAQCMLADKYMDGDGVGQDYMKAAALYLKAESQHQLTPQAARRLARCYQLKVSILPDLDKSTERISQLEKLQKNNKIELLLNKISSSSATNK